MQFPELQIGLKIFRQYLFQKYFEVLNYYLSSTSKKSHSKKKLICSFIRHIYLKDWILHPFRKKGEIDFFGFFYAENDLI